MPQATQDQIDGILSDLLRDEMEQTTVPSAGILEVPALQIPTDVWAWIRGGK